MISIQENTSLKPYNTFGIDVKTKYFIEYSSVEELEIFLTGDLFSKNRHLHIGSGSNLLFLKDFEGIVLHSKIKFIEKENETDNFVVLRVGAGVIWDDFVKYCVANNLYGVENLSLIPGETGAAAVQNIGAYGVEIKDHIEMVETVEIPAGNTRKFSYSECKYGYRKSIFKENLKGQYIITHVFFRLNKLPDFKLEYQHLKETVIKNGGITLQNVRDTIIAIRQSKLPDPAETGNAGSFFMNPVIVTNKYRELKQIYPGIPHYTVSETEEKIPAGWLIEQCGWKGKRVGNVGVHQNQALVIVNFGNATGKEIAEIASQIQADVSKKFGIDIIPEVNYIE